MASFWCFFFSLSNMFHRVFPLKSMRDWMDSFSLSVWSDKINEDRISNWKKRSKLISQTRFATVFKLGIFNCLFLDVLWFCQSFCRHKTARNIKVGTSLNTNHKLLSDKILFTWSFLAQTSLFNNNKLLSKLQSMWNLVYYSWMIVNRSKLPYTHRRQNSSWLKISRGRIFYFSFFRSFIKLIWFFSVVEFLNCFG